MKSILEKIVALRGVHQACVYQNGDMLVSTFPKDKEEGVSNATQAIEQMFSALLAIEKTHNEVYFSMQNSLLIGYLFDGDYLIVLHTESKINLPLIHMGVKSAFVKIKALPSQQEHLIVTPSPSPIEEIIPPPPVAEQNQPIAPPVVAKTMTITAYMHTVMDNLKTLLIDYLGPAAVFIFDDGVNQWREQDAPSKETLINLIEILALELNAGDEYNEFVVKAKGFL
jgi:predicted regulator of Ras-like GTPase activity (Roadblock/LC7/MglB family)